MFLIVLCFAFFCVQKNIGTGKAAAELEQLATNIRRYYQNRPDYWGLSTKTVIDKKISPQNLLKNNQMIGFFGNPVFVGQGVDANIVMPGARSFDIIYKELNEKQCIELASFKFTPNFWLGITGITIINNDGDSLFFTWDDQTNVLPIKKGAAQDICDEKNVIIWHNEQ